MEQLEKFLGCKNKFDITKITLNIYHPDLISKTTQLFRYYMKSLVNFNSPDAPHKKIIRKKRN